MSSCLEHTFFSLLHSALWEETPVLNGTLCKEDWYELFAISKEQTVSGIILDAIAKLPDEQKPPFELRMQWIAMQKNIERQNSAMNNVVAELFEDLRKRNVEGYLLKGQGVAQNYAKPLHRVCGDIDLYFNNISDFEKALDLFKEYNCSIEDNSEESHAETVFKGIKIELHKKCALFYSQRLQKKFNSIVSTLVGNGDTFFSINDSAVTMLPPILNALQLLSHMLRHIIFSGLGLRQICDWVLFINKYHNEIDKTLFLKYLEELELLGTYKAIMAIATGFMGLPKEFVLCEIKKSDIRMARKVLNLVMKYGNFGQYGEHSVMTSKSQYLNAYIWKVKNCMRFHAMAKSETLSYPIWQLHSISDVLFANINNLKHSV